MTTRLTTRSRTLRRSVLLAAGAAAALAVAACGGDAELTSDVPGEVAVEGGADDAVAPDQSGAGDGSGGGEISAQEAEQIALAAAPEGSVLDDDDTERETEAGQPAWEVEIDYPNGEEWDYYVHRETGEILATELDEGADDDDGTDDDDGDDDDR